MSHLASRRSLLLGSLASALPACDARSSNGAGRAAFWYSYGGKNREVLERLLARFHADPRRPRIDATFQGDYFESLAKVRTAIAVGAAPAMTHVVSEVVPYLAEAGALEPLDGYEGAADLDLVPEIAQSGTYEGGARRPLLAIPFNRSVPIMYVNGTMLERAGVAIPRDWGELRAAANALTVRRGAEVAVWGFECPVSWLFWVALVASAGGRVVDEGGTVTLGGDAGARALDLWQTLTHRDRVMRPPLGRDYNAWQVGTQDFLSGRAAILWSSTAFLRYIEENARFPVKVAPLARDHRHAIPAGGTFFVLLRAAEEREKRAAWQFLRWMTEREQTMEWATSTGYLPVTRAAITELARNGFYDAHANDKVVLGELGSVEPWPWSPTLFRVQREIMDPLLEDAVLQGTNAAEALAKGRREALLP
ncbi:MAG TPA: ABC transporter substrate-binding protein [Polyangiaceae bacterium]|nr:ABC transporter substrate-binding protein [Polyangiaceae bacterium]